MITIPTSCPSCQSKLVRVKDQLFCRSTTCPAKNSKIVENYAKKVKIKGLGPAAIAKLELETISDIYELTEEILVDILGKNGEKVYKEIQNKTSIPLPLFLGSVSIPLLGQATAKKITTTIENITLDSLSKDGVGAKASEYLLNWLASNDIPYGITFKEEIVPTNTFTTGITICISGRIPGYTKASLETYLQEHGILVSSGVTKGTDYLLSQTNTSAKAQKAIKQNIKIINLDELKEIVNEYTT